ncbi:hypothetical protein EXU48_06305 [Occultella glacieicola]|uniref:DUF6318 domain-containing protein n=1 Tax=Occultella glacieicola TaxID=2518684 RepID=A0ABY2E5Y0_9MICO|nr:DUF6318 family protein [Occultella glacieicola]TDE95869.1 hypothetical protein EXU48_06305 [Occultella glacieicola]
MTSGARIRIRRSAAAVTVLTALVLIHGCDGGTSAEQPNDVAGGTVATAGDREKNTLAGVAPPVRTAAMDDSGPEGAAAAAAYVVGLLPYLSTSGDLDEWEAMAAEDCADCTRIADEAAALHARGGRTSGGEVEILHAFTDESAGEEGRRIVELDVVQAPSTTIAGDGTQVPQPNGRYPEVRVSLVWSGGGWRVDGMDLGSGPFPVPLSEPPADLDDPGPAGAYRVTLDVVEGARTITYADGTSASAPSGLHTGIVVATRFGDDAWVIEEVALP